MLDHEDHGLMSQFEVVRSRAKGAGALAADAYWALAAIPKKQQDSKAPGRSEARAVGALLLAGAGLVALSLVLPHPSGGDTPALIAHRRGDGGRRPALLAPRPPRPARGHPRGPRRRPRR